MDRKPEQSLDLCPTLPRRWGRGVEHRLNVRPRVDSLWPSLTLAPAPPRGLHDPACSSRLRGGKKPTTATKTLRTQLLATARLTASGPVGSRLTGLCAGCPRGPRGAVGVASARLLRRPGGAVCMCVRARARPEGGRGGWNSSARRQPGPRASLPRPRPGAAGPLPSPASCAPAAG